MEKEGVIRYHLTECTCRLGELKRVMPGVNQCMLTKQPHELETDGIIPGRSMGRCRQRLNTRLPMLAKA